MFLLVDINLILLFIIFMTRMNILTNQQFISIDNNNRSRFIFDRRSIMFSINSTFRKHFDLNNHLTHLTLSKKPSRKRRQSTYDFNSESLKYFTCAVVRKREKF